MDKVILFACWLLLFSLPSSGEEVAPGLLRTPDLRFANLADFPYDANYAQFNGVRIHYLDEGPKTGKPILLLHGLPTWSYLYRHY